MKFYFADFSEFFAMGKHGFYVWMSYGLVLAVLAFLAWRPSWQLSQLKKQYATAQKRKQTVAAGDLIPSEGNQS